MSETTTILLRARADVEVDNPPGFAVLRLTPGSARRYLDLMARAGDLESEIPGFLRLEVSDYEPGWWTWTEPLDEVMYEPVEGPQRWQDELDYRVVDAADLQGRLEDELEPAHSVSDDLVNVRVEKEGLSWEGVIRHTDVVIWTRKLPADVVREVAGALLRGEGEEPWTWAPPAGEETEFAFMPPGGVFLFRRLRPEGVCPYDPEYWGKVEEPGADARYLANRDASTEVDGDRQVLHVAEAIRTFEVHTTERWTVDVAYTIAARDEEEAQRLVEHGLVDYDHHEHPGHDDQVLTVECIEEI